MKEKLLSEEGKTLFRLRSQTVEPVFGQMKWNTGFDRFLTWGFEGACAEVALESIAHNVKKCLAKALPGTFSLSTRAIRAFLPALMAWHRRSRITTTRSVTLTAGLF